MKNKSSSLWTSSPCTLAFSQHNTIFQKQNRFSLHSIYHTQKIHPKIPYKIQLIRPESCLIDFRRQIQQTLKFRRKNSKNSRSMHLLKSFAKQPSSTKIQCSTNQNSTVQRLTSQQAVQMDKIYDRNGIRSTFYQSSGQQKIRYSFKKCKSQKGNLEKKFKGPKVYVSGSTRMDLSKPQNFNPGPGSYFMDKRDNQQVCLLYRKAHKWQTNKIQKQKEKDANLLKQKNKEQNQGIFEQGINKKNKKGKLSKISCSVRSKQKLTFYSLA